MFLAHCFPFGFFCFAFSRDVFCGTVPAPSESVNLTGRWEVITSDRTEKKSNEALKDKYICLQVLGKAPLPLSSHRDPCRCVCIHICVCVTESNRVAGIALQPEPSRWVTGGLSSLQCGQKAFYRSPYVSRICGFSITDRLSFSVVPIVDHYVIIFMDTVWR